MSVFIAFQKSTDPTANTHKTWNNITATSVTNQALVDENNQATAYTFSYTDSPAGTITGNGIDEVGQGSAAWVDEAVINNSGHYFNSSVPTCTFTVDGLEGNVDLRFKCSSDMNRVGNIRVNGGSWETLSPPSNGVRRDHQVEFLDVTPSSGVITVDLDWVSGNGTYIMAMEITTTSAPTPSISLSGVYAPGQTISATLTNYIGTPTQATLTDTGNNSVSVDLIAAGNDYTFTLPDLPDAGNDTAGLLFGDVTVTIDDPGV